jgi:hypothetical protein
MQHNAIERKRTVIKLMGCLRTLKNVIKSFRMVIERLMKPSEARGTMFERMGTARLRNKNVYAFLQKSGKTTIRV